MRILVVYATEHGSTRQIAERIGDRLGEAGHEVDVKPAATVTDLAEYSAVVLGSAIHNGRWLSTAEALIRGNCTELHGHPVWLFSVSCVGANSGAFSRPVNSLLRAVRRETPQIRGFRTLANVQDHRDFTGVIAKEDWPSLGRIIFRVFTGRFGDHIDWHDVDSWAHCAAAKLSVS